MNLQLTQCFLCAVIWPCTLINHRKQMSWSWGKERCTVWWRNVRTDGLKERPCARELLEFSRETTSHLFPGTTHVKFIWTEIMFYILMNVHISNSCITSWVKYYRNIKMFSYFFGFMAVTQCSESEIISWLWMKVFTADILPYYIKNIHIKFMSFSIQK